MSRDLSKKRTAWMVIDETGSEVDDDFPSHEEDSDSNYQVGYEPSKVTAKKKEKGEVLVVNLDKPKHKASKSDKSEATNSRSAVRRKRERGLDCQTDVKGEDTSLGTHVTWVTENAIKIDDDEDDENIKTKASVPTKNRKRKGSIETVVAKKTKTTGASSSKKTLAIDKEEDYEIEDSDAVVEYRSSRTTGRRDKDKTSSKDKDVKLKTSIAVRDVRKKGSDSKTDVREAGRSAETNVVMLSKNDIEIIIDDEDDEDVKLEGDALVKSINRREVSADSVAGKRLKTSQASSSKRDLDVASASEKPSDDKNEDCDDFVIETVAAKKTKTTRASSSKQTLATDKEEDYEKQDSDTVVEYQSSRKTGRKDKDKTSIKDKNVKLKASTAVADVRKKGSDSKTDVREAGRSPETNVTMLSKNDIQIITDDEDDEDFKLEGDALVKSINRREVSADSVAGKRLKTSQASSSKRDLDVASASDKPSDDKNEDCDDFVLETVAAKKTKTTRASSSKQTLATDKEEDYEKQDSDAVVEYQSSRKTGRKDKDKTSIKDKNIKLKASTVVADVRKQGSDSKADVREAGRSPETNVTMLSKNDIQIITDDEDDEDFKLEADALVKSINRREVSADSVAGKRVKTSRASSSKRDLDVASASDKPSDDKNEDCDDFVVETVAAKKTKTTRASSSKQTLANDKEEDYEKQDSDAVVEYQSSRKTGRKNKDKTSIKDKNVELKTSTAVTDVRKKGSDSKTDVKEAGPKTNVTVLSKNDIQIIIDDEDDEDVRVEGDVSVKSLKKREASTETVNGKRVRSSQACSSKWNLDVDSASDKPSEDKNDDSDYVVESQSSKKPERKLKHESPVIDLDKPNHKISTKYTGATTCRDMAEARKKRFESHADLSEEERSSHTEATSLASNEITIDDEDDEEIELKTEVPIKKTKRKGSNETATAKKAKIVEASSSKKKLKIDKKDEDLAAVKPEDEKQEKKHKIDEFNDKVAVEWTESDYLSEFNQIEPQIAENLISLFEKENTIPFIARYRKEMTGGMEPEQLRNIKNTYDNLKAIKLRGLSILKSIDKLGKWSPEIHYAITAAKTLTELEVIYTPFKPGAKGSLAERAKELGLATIGETILQGRAIPSFDSLIDSSREGLKNEKDVKQGIIYIIADVISKDKTTFEGIRKLRKIAVIKIETTKSKAASSSKTNTDEHNINLQKYEKYFEFVSSERTIKDYQILAINRAESKKILTVKVTIPDWFQKELKAHCLAKYNFVRKVSDFHYNIIEESFDNAYIRLIRPLVTRQVRHDLNEKAENSSMEVFASNLKKLLLSPPLRGKTILGIDPGFNHGCKLAVISQCGNVLDTATIYPHCKHKYKMEQVQILANLMKKHNCTIVALGNATACRETERFLTDLIQSGVFAPLDVCYTIVNEAGASIYSCSNEAKTEFPNLDPNIISAISIARRLQDPLAELIKVEPKHLGIGMYQHDLTKKQLQLTLDEVITETVSFVGVDVNTASHCLLRKVAGLSATRAANIITRRDQCGLFTNRQQLLKVKGIGQKFFEQCAGFIRIIPETATTGNRSSAKERCLDYLDQTWIHPESYDVARRFLKACKCDLNQLGTESFIQQVSSYGNGNRKNLADQFGTSEHTMDIIIRGLSMKKGEDIRIEEEGPLFQRNLRSIDDLSINVRLTGSVRNVTNFGAFVDVGVGTNGLIPIGKMRGRTLSLGEKVEVVVLSIDKERGRISLSLFE